MFQIDPKEIGADLALFLVQYTNTAKPTSKKIAITVMAIIILG